MKRKKQRYSFTVLLQVRDKQSKTVLDVIDLNFRSDNLVLLRGLFTDIGSHIEAMEEVQKKFKKPETKRITLVEVSKSAKTKSTN